MLVDQPESPPWCIRRSPEPARDDDAQTGTTRFTLDGSAELERHLAAACQQVLNGLRAILPDRLLEAVLLGGGYGRGEGGVLRTTAGDQPYNDLEFYVFLRGNLHWNERRWSPGLDALAERLSPAAGLHVELKILSQAKLRRSPISMFYYDLVAGHRWILGDESLLADCAHHHSAENTPLAEATRLLMNRLSGVLFAQQKLRQQTLSPVDHDFVGRNLAKAKLALGDAVLTVSGLYHWSVRERHRRLLELAPPERPPWLKKVQQHHAAGLEFKLHPQPTEQPRSAWQDQSAELTELSQEVWLWLEGRRLRQSFASIPSYVLSGINKCPETNRQRNRLVNAKVFGIGEIFRLGAGRHPGERILDALALMLWAPGALREPDSLRFLQNPLRTSAASFPELVQAYHSLWRRLN